MSKLSGFSCSINGHNRSSRCRTHRGGFSEFIRGKFAYNRECYRHSPSYKDYYPSYSHSDHRSEEDDDWKVGEGIRARVVNLVSLHAPFLITEFSSKTFIPSFFLKVLWFSVGILIALTMLLTD